MKAFLSLGTNLGDRENFLSQARNFLHDPPRTNLVRSSEILNTEAMDFISQPDFLNQVLEIETILSPIELLDFTQSIEKKMGRIKRFDKGPREIDIDILLYEGIVEMNVERLTLPHHSIESRPFIGRLMKSLTK